jgi:hypothetical protein
MIAISHIQQQVGVHLCPLQGWYPQFGMFQPHPRQGALVLDHDILPDDAHG